VRSLAATVAWRRCRSGQECDVERGGSRDLGCRLSSRVMPGLAHGGASYHRVPVGCSSGPQLVVGHGGG